MPDLFDRTPDTVSEWVYIAGLFVVAYFAAQETYKRNTHLYTLISFIGFSWGSVVLLSTLVDQFASERYSEDTQLILTWLIGSIIGLGTTFVVQNAYRDDHKSDPDHHR